MATIEKRTISLPSDQAASIDAKVSVGDYASASEVVREGIPGSSIRQPRASTR